MFIPPVLALGLYCSVIKRSSQQLQPQSITMCEKTYLAESADLSWVMGSTSSWWHQSDQFPHFLIGQYSRKFYLRPSKERTIISVGTHPCSPAIFTKENAICNYLFDSRAAKYGNS